MTERRYPTSSAGTSRWQQPLVKGIVACLEQSLGVSGFEAAYGGDIVGGPWRDNPRGFKFSCDDRASLIAALSASTNFATPAEPRWIQRLRGDVQFREVSNRESLHLLIPLDTGKPCVVHLDSVSIVEGRDPSGKIIYKNVDTIQRHLAVDYDLKRLHFDIDERRIQTPLDGERGTNF